MRTTFVWLRETATEEYLASTKPTLRLRIGLVCSLISFAFWKWIHVLPAECFSVARTVPSSLVRVFYTASEFRVSIPRVTRTHVILDACPGTQDFPHSTAPGHGDRVVEIAERAFEEVCDVVLLAVTGSLVVLLLRQELLQRT